MKCSTLGILAALTNFGLLAFNGGFSMADSIAAPNPAVFSTFGQWSILVWGLAFLAAGISDAGWAVWAAFVVEKAGYVAVWLQWISANPDALTKLLAALPAAQAAGDVSAILAPTFHLIYGPIDTVFMLLFLGHALRKKRAEGAAAEARKAD